MCVASLHESFNANWMSPVVLRAVLWSQLQVWMFECQCEYLKNIFGSLYCIFEIIFAYLGESLLRLMSNHFLHSVYDKVSKSNHLYLTAWWLWLGECVILRHWIAALRMETSQHVWIITNCWVPPPPLHVAACHGDDNCPADDLEHFTSGPGASHHPRQFVTRSVDPSLKRMLLEG